MEYSDNALSVFKKLYFAENENHPDQVFGRVADVVSEGCPDENKRESFRDDFFKIMSNGYFRPNTPAMINCGCQENPQTAACFVGKQEDDLKSILDFDREAALVFASGSGIGINYGQLREKGAVLSSGGDSSGPFAFMKKLAATGDAVKSGGRSRRSAIMSMMFDHHPDLLDFITIKNGSDQSLRSMNLSVAISDDFMKAVKNDELWRLVGVVDGKVKKELPARDVFDKIARNAHKTGDPGVWFIDRANRDNGLLDVSGPYLSTNPCVTRETLVAVADGRNYVPIKQLAEEGFDIPVHCVDPKSKKPFIRMGRNPRKTRTNVPILKIKLDDGSIIRTTEDHKFLDFDGNKVKAKDLYAGQRFPGPSRRSHGRENCYHIGQDQRWHMCLG